MSKYVIDDSTLTGIADAIRAKDETSDLIPVEEMAERIGAIETGVTLPTLSNPASPSEILNGYEAIGEDGSVIEGTALETASTATAADIMSGKTAYDNLGNLLTGAMTQGLKMTEYTFGPSFIPTSEYEHYKDFTYSVASGFAYVIIVATKLSTPAVSDSNKTICIRIGSTLYVGYTGGGISVRSFSGTSLKIRLGGTGYAGSYSAALKVYGFK